MRFTQEWPENVIVTHFGSFPGVELLDVFRAMAMPTITMHALTLAGIDMPLSRIGFGCMRLAPSQELETFPRLDAYRALGGNLFDTAEVYGQGQSEKALGQYLRKTGGREGVVIVTKGCVEPKLLRPECILRAIEGSLERLQLDVIDVYLLHRDDPTVPVGELVDTLNAAADSGKIRAFGVSNWPVKRIDDANRYASTRGIRHLTVSSPHVSLLVPREPWWPGCTHATPRDLSWYREKNLVVLGWSAQARGFLDQQPPTDTAYLAELIRVYFSQDNLEKRRRVHDLAKRLGCHPGRLAIAYVLGLDAPTIALFGPRSVADVHEVMAARDIELSQMDRRWLELVD
ncbi:MAG TPA: aldo/keto reductase [Polyangiaceae bacterium]